MGGGESSARQTAEGTSVLPRPHLPSTGVGPSKGRVETGCSRSPAMLQQSLCSQPAPWNLSELRHTALCQQSRKSFFSVHPWGYPARTSPSIQARRAETGGQPVLTRQGVVSEAQLPPARDELASMTTSGLNEDKRRIFVKHLDGRVRGK